jgi:hypothetical protein
MVGNDWIEHRRGDGERVGWIVPRGEDFVVVDLLGREQSGAVDWLSAEEILEELDIGYLADKYLLTLEDGGELRVRIAEITAASITVKKDDFGAVGAPQLYYTLDLPARTRLRPLAADEDAATRLSPESLDS